MSLTLYFTCLSACLPVLYIRPSFLLERKHGLQVTFLNFQFFCFSFYLKLFSIFFYNSLNDNIFLIRPRRGWRRTAPVDGSVCAATHRRGAGGPGHEPVVQPVCRPGSAGQPGQRGQAEHQGLLVSMVHNT